MHMFRTFWQQNYPNWVTRFNGPCSCSDRCAKEHKNFKVHPKTVWNPACTVNPPATSEIKAMPAQRKSPLSDLKIVERAWWHERKIFEYLLSMSGYSNNHHSSVWEGTFIFPGVSHFYKWVNTSAGDMLTSWYLSREDTKRRYICIMDCKGVDKKLGWLQYITIPMGWSHFSNAKGVCNMKILWDLASMQWGQWVIAASVKDPA